MTATTGKMASNGSQDKRLSGMARVQESCTWSTACVMHDAASEAERLCNDVYNAVHAAYFDTKTAAETAASDHIRDKAAEARRCLYAAANYLTALIGDAEPPF
jgi:hypothetical protein